MNCKTLELPVWQHCRGGCDRIPPSVIGASHGYSSEHSTGSFKVTVSGRRFQDILSWGSAHQSLRRPFFGGWSVVWVWSVSWTRPPYDALYSLWHFNDIIKATMTLIFYYIIIYHSYNIQFRLFDILMICYRMTSKYIYCILYYDFNDIQYGDFSWRTILCLFFLSHITFY